MLKTIVPKNRYWTADYPNLDPDYEGVIIPRRYGIKEDVMPICVNTETGLFHIADHAIKSVSDVYVGDEELDAGEYNVNLLSATIEIGTTPLLTAGGTYYFMVSGIDIDAGNYLEVYTRDHGGAYSDYYTINAAGNWAGSGTGKAICFTTKWRHELSDGDSANSWGVEWGSVSDERSVDLGDDAARTGLGMKFTAPAIFGKPSYLVWMRLWFQTNGNPTSTDGVQITIYEEGPGGAGDIGDQVGAASKIMWNSYLTDAGYGSTDPDDFYYQTDTRWGIREARSEKITCTVNGRYDDSVSGDPAMTNIADIVEDMMVEVMGVPTAALDSPAFASLAAEKTEEMSLHMETEMEFQQFLETAEAGQRWKLVPTLSRLFSPQWFNPAIESGDDILHLRDEDFVYFSMSRDLDAVRYQCIIRYDEEPGGGGGGIVEESSAFALFFYRNEETMDMTSWFKNGADATASATEYLDVLKEPLITARFEIKGHGFDLLPMDRVYLTRERALYEGGTLDKVLFRIFNVQKKVSSKTTEITAVLDSQVSP